MHHFPSPFLNLYDYSIKIFRYSRLTSESWRRIQVSSSQHNASLNLFASDKSLHFILYYGSFFNATILFNCSCLTFNRLGYQLAAVVLQYKKTGNTVLSPCYLFLSKLLSVYITLILSSPADHEFIRQRR